MILLATVLVLPAQIPAPPMGSSKDLETWTRDVGDVPDLEHGVGLHLAGDYPLIVTFAGIKLRRDPRAPASEVIVQARPAAALDPGRLLSPTLVLMVTGKDKKQTTIDASSRVTTYPPGPFMTTPASVSLRAALTPPEFLSLAGAETARGSMLGLNVTFRPDQLAALRALSDRLGFVAR
jgi:hypothetical protein